MVYITSFRFCIGSVYIYAYAWVHHNRLQGHVADRLIAEGFKHYNFFHQLKVHYSDTGLKYFQLTSKGHHAMHACLQSTSLQPRTIYKHDLRRASISVYTGCSDHCVVTCNTILMLWLRCNSFQICLQNCKWIANEFVATRYNSVQIMYIYLYM